MRNEEVDDVCSFVCLSMEGRLKPISTNSTNVPVDSSGNQSRESEDVNPRDGTELKATCFGSWW